MNKKAFELAISTLVLIVSCVLILTGLTYVVTDGFKTFRQSTKPFLDTTQASSVKQACSLACSNQDKLTFCCREYDIDDMKIKCADERLALNCNIDCANFSC